MRIFLGCDPGVSGGLAGLKQVPGKALEICLLLKRPETEEEIADELDKLLTSYPSGQIVCALERTKGRGTISIDKRCTNCGRKMRQNIQPAGMAKFFTEVGIWIGMLAQAGIPRVEVTPPVWMKKMGAKGGDKGYNRRMAQARFPGHKITNHTAEAVLLAWYCSKLDQGDFDAF